MASYLRSLLPPEAWSFVAAEPAISRLRPDLLWREGATGRILLDEIKTGGFSGRTERVDAQIGRYAVAAHAQYGDAFAGVRLVFTSYPARSVLCRPDGSVTPLNDAGLLHIPAAGPRVVRAGRDPRAGRPVQLPTPRGPPKGSVGSR